MQRSNQLGAVVLVLAATVMACESTGPEDNAALALSFAVTGEQSGLAASLSAVVIPITDGTHTLDLQQVFVQIGSVETEVSGDVTGTDSDSDSENDSDSDGGHDEDLTLGPVTVELPLEGGIVTPITEPLPAGNYSELELDIESLRLVGTFDGEAFDVTVPVDMDLELELNPPLVLEEGSPFNVTVDISVASWFRTGNGAIIDPRTLATDEDARAAFRQRVALAIDAFEDSDRDGDDADSDSDSH